MKKYTHFSGSFRKKLILGFITSSLVPLLLAVSIFYLTSVSIARDKILDTVDLSGNLLYESVNQRIEQLDRLSDSLQYYIYVLSATPQIPTTKYLAVYNQIRSFISSMSDSFHLTSIEIYIDPDNIVSNEGIMFKKLDTLDQLLTPDERERTGISTGWKLYQNRKIIAAPAGNADPADYLSCYCTKSNINSQELEYAYFLNIPCQELSDILSGPYADTGIESFLTDTSGQIIAHPDTDKTGTSIDPLLLAAVMDSSKSWFSYNANQILVRRLEKAPWFLITVVPDSYIRQNTGILINMVMVISILIIIATCFTVFFITRTVTRRINLLSTAISNFRQDGNNSSLAPLKNMISNSPKIWDEIDELAHSFLEMSDRLDDSFQKILDMSLTEEKLNYQLLQSKINPHFLYNILESIKTCQTLGCIDTANLMITKLAKFYRQLLQKGDDLITIRDELEMIVTYLEIESLCRKDSIRWVLDLDDEIDNFLICKFTLQPIVENCIVHGIRSASEPLTIHIRIRYGEDIIIIQVQDDGAGIPSAQLYNIQTALEQKNIFCSKHYGISNVNARLSIISRGDSKISINSLKGKGTTVTITIPQMIV